MAPPHPARLKASVVYNMPSGTVEKPQQPITNGFPGSNLYTNKNIWNSSFSHARDRSIASNKDSDENPSGSSALNPNSEAVPWTSRPWNTTNTAPPPTSGAENPSRSVSTSPNRTRDGAIINGAGIFDGSHPALGLAAKSSFPSQGFPDETNGFTGPFGQQKRPSQEGSYISSMAAFNSAPSDSRDHSVPPSRQSQGSPGFPDMYRAGHTPHNSISQRHVHHPSASFSRQSQTSNQRAYTMNQQLNQQLEDDNLATHLSRAMTLDANAQHGSNFNPASPAFQLNPGSQSWNDPTTLKADGTFELPSDTLPSGTYGGINRQPADRLSPAPAYRPDTGSNGNRSYAHSPDTWAASRSSSRDPRAVEVERRGMPAHQFAAQNYGSPFYPGHGNQYPFGMNHQPQYPHQFVHPYSQTIQPALMASYAMQSLPGNYQLQNTITPVRPARHQDPSQGMRSPLLEEFRQSSKSKQWSLKDFYGHIVEFSGDQHGSRHIQTKLETANSDEKDQVFREIEPNAVQLMKDVFGNYVVQKFFEHGNQIQKKVLAEKMKGKVVDLSMQVYACRVVQKALEHVLVEQQAELTKELEADIVRVIRDQNGNHVIQKIIELVPRNYLDFIMDAIRGQVSALSSHMYGCRVIQRMLEHGTEADKEELMAELHPAAQMLIQDQFGNYVAQHVIKHGKQEDREKIIALVLGQASTLSKHKFASNVVEKCLERGTAQQRSTLREQLCAPGNENNLQQMIRDQYGNYVVQKLLSHLTGSERGLFIEAIRPQFEALKENGTSKQIQALDKYMEVAPTKTDGISSSTSTDANSTAPTPVLTNETNSPQSSSPPSTHVSTVDVAAGTGTQKASEVVVEGARLQGEEA